MDQWYVTYVTDSNEENIDCIFAESVIHACEKFYKLNSNICKIVKVELKR